MPRDLEERHRRTVGYKAVWVNTLGKRGPAKLNHRYPTAAGA